MRKRIRFALMIALSIGTFLAAQGIGTYHASLYDSFGTKYRDQFRKYYELSTAFDEEEGDHDLAIARRYWSVFSGNLILRTEGQGLQATAYALEKQPYLFSDSSFNVVDFEGIGFDFTYGNGTLSTFLARLSDRIDNESREEEKLDLEFGDYVTGFRFRLDKADFGKFITNFSANTFFDDYIFFDLSMLEVSYVNAFRVLDTYKSIGRGTTEATNEYSFYLRITSLEPNNLASKASIYDVLVTLDGVRQDVTILDKPGVSKNTARDPKGRFITEVSNGNAAVYKVTMYLTNTLSNANACEARILVANDYVVQISEEDAFEDVTSPTHVPSDVIFIRDTFTTNYSNLRLLRYKVGRETSYHNVGVKVMWNLLGLNFLYSYNKEFPYRRFPSDSLTNTVMNKNEAASYHYLLMTGRVRSLRLEGDLYYVDAAYSGVFAPARDSKYLLFDDDDNNDYTRGMDASGAITGPELPSGIDVDNNEVYDFQQAFVGLTVVPFFFLYGYEDRNNNDLPDDMEDDAYVDLAFRNNSFGHSLRATLPYEGGAFTLAYYNEKTIMREKRSIKVEAFGDYTHRFDDKSGFRFEGTLAKVNDEIEDYALNREDFQYLLHSEKIVKTEIPRKVMLYENSVKVAFAGEFFLSFLDGFTLRTKTKMQQNVQLDKTNSIFKGGVFFDLAYTKRFFDIFELVVKNRAMYMTLEDMNDIYPGMDASSVLNNTGVMLNAYFGKTITFKTGYNIRLFHDNTFSSNDIMAQSVAFNVFITAPTKRDIFAYGLFEYHNYKSLGNAFTQYDEFLLSLGFGARY